MNSTVYLYVAYTDSKSYQIWEEGGQERTNPSISLYDLVLKALFPIRYIIGIIFILYYHQVCRWDRGQTAVPLAVRQNISLCNS